MDAMARSLLSQVGGLRIDYEEAAALTQDVRASAFTDDVKARVITAIAERALHHSTQLNVTRRAT